MALLPILPEFEVFGPEQHTPASEWLKGIPLTLSKPSKLGEVVGRELDIVNQARVFNIPNRIRRWEEVKWRVGIHTAAIYCLPDFFCIGTDDDWVYTPMNPITAETIGREILRAVLPTKAIVDRVFNEAKVRLYANPMTPPSYPYDSSMMNTSRWSVQTSTIRKALGSYDTTKGSISDGQFKNIVVGHGLSKTRGRTVGIYGWASKRVGSASNQSWAIQGPGVNWGSHEWSYCDYSHGVRFISEKVVVDGQTVLLKNALKDPAMSALFVPPEGHEYNGSPKGPMKFASYHEAMGI